MARTRVRWGRVLALAVLASLALGLLMAGVGRGEASTGRSGDGGDRRAVHAYVVQPGDTLWSIAQKVVGAHEDPRPVVDRLAQVNHVRSAIIIPGQVLQLDR